MNDKDENDDAIEELGIRKAIRDEEKESAPPSHRILHSSIIASSGGGSSSLSSSNPRLQSNGSVRLEVSWMRLKVTALNC
jgi:hypothetical protein